MYDVLQQQCFSSVYKHNGESKKTNVVPKHIHISKKDQRK